jgi:hypothetical protein
MTYRMSEEDSIAYLEGGWDAYNVEEIILRDLVQREIAEPTAVLLSDGTTAFYVATGEIV